MIITARAHPIVSTKFTSDILAVRAQPRLLLPGCSEATTIKTQLLFDDTLQRQFDKRNALFVGKYVQIRGKRSRSKFLLLDLILRRVPPSLQIVNCGPQLAAHSIFKAKLDFWPAS